MKNHAEALIFHTAVCAENVTNSPYPTGKTAYAAFSCGSSNSNTFSEWRSKCEERKLYF